MEYYKNTLCVEAGWLIDEGVVSECNYRHLTRRGQIEIVRRGCRNTPALVAWESIPERFRRTAKERLGNDPHTLAKIGEIEKHIRENAELSDYFDNYEISPKRFLPKQTRLEYYNNAIVLDAIHAMLNEKRAFRRSRGHGAPRRWGEISEGVQELNRKRYPHTLPANPRRLEDRYKRYINEGAISLIHKNFTNKHAAKVDDDVKESFIVQFLADPRNLDNAQVARLYNMVAETMNWKKITPAAVAVWRDKLDLTIYAGRRGSTAFSNKKEMQAKRSAPTAPLFYWTLDGWDAELLYQKEEKGVTGYHHRPTVVMVLDPCVKYIIGYAVGTHECPELIQAALRNAAQHTELLFGRMYRAHQIQSDRYAIKKMTPFYGVVADKVTPAKAKNAKSKVIEPYFNYYNRKWCQLMPNWSGFGVKSDEEKQPNIEFLNKYKKNFPDFEGVCQQIEMIIERERAEKVERYLELWSGLEENRKIELSRENYLLQFGETTGRTILMQGSGLHPTICGQRRTYDCFDLSFRDHASTKWQVRYDPDDLSRVLAVNEEETLRYVMEEKYIQPMALADRKPGDSDELQRIREYNKELKATVIERRTAASETMHNALEGSNILENETLRKLLITDSAGQHKNNKYKKLAPKKDYELAEVVSFEPVDKEDNEDNNNNFFNRY